METFGVKVPKLTPLITQDLYGNVVLARIFEGMAVRDPYTLEWLPQLARSWKISDDGLTIRFQIKQGVSFSDGHPLTAEDVVWTFNWIMNPKVQAPRLRAYFDRVASVTATGPYEVVWRFKEPYFESFALAAEMSVMPEHFYSRYGEEDFNKSTGLVLGTGPYRMESATDWTPEQTLQLVRNENYWGEPPSFDRIIYKIVENEKAEVTQFRNGEVDLIGVEPESYRELLKDEALLSRTQHLEYWNPRAGYTFIGWAEVRNSKPTVFADKRVRQALTLMTDRQGICDQIFLGYGRPSTGPFDAQGLQADPNVKALPYDPERAKTILAGLGFRDRGQRVLVNEKAEALRFKMTYPSGSPTNDRIALFLKDNFAKAGVAMEPDPQEWSVLLQKMNNRDFDAVMLGWGGSVESDIYQEFHSSQIADNGDNFIAYRNPELDKLAVQARATMDEAKRMSLWQACHRVLAEDQPYTFLTCSKSLIFFDSRIRNVGADQDRFELRESLVHVISLVRAQGPAKVGEMTAPWSRTLPGACFCCSPRSSA